MKRIILLGIMCGSSFSVFSQEDSTFFQKKPSHATPRLDYDSKPAEEPRYKLNLPVDAAIVLPATAWVVYAFPKIYDKPNIDSATVVSLKRESIPAFDRWAVRHSDKADAASNIAFYASIPYPAVLFADRAIRKDAAKVAALYWEAMAITGLLYTGTDYLVDRYRPETYDETKPLGERMSGNEKNAFFAGHVALVSTATFFTASIYDAYHPTSGWKWAFYGVAAAATGATIYLRHVAGKHFPSDLLVGTIVGMSSGMLVPRLHRYHPGKKQSWMLTPSAGEGYGLTAVYHF